MRINVVHMVKNLNCKEIASFKYEMQLGDLQIICYQWDSILRECTLVAASELLMKHQKRCLPATKN